MNERAARLVDELVARERELGIVSSRVAGAQIIDCGVKAPGSIAAGQWLARICISDLGQVTHSMGQVDRWPCPRVTVDTRQPTVACLLSQYAGWKISVGSYFAMGSGPMRAIARKEVFFDEPPNETQGHAVGVLESSQLPDETVVEWIAQEIKRPPTHLTLLVARTASLAGSYQVVARSVETCLHKLHEIGFDVEEVRGAIGSAFLPPIPKDDLTAIGRTNDSILYGGEVCLYVHSDDAQIEALGPTIPSSSSPDHGQLFRDLFKRAGGDFYKIDPLLFSPAVVVMNNLATGSCRRFGVIEPRLLLESFYGEKVTPRAP